MSASPEGLDPVATDIAKPDATPEAVAAVAVSVAQDLKAEDVTVLDLSGLNSYCDLFVLCTGTSARQVRAIANAIGAEVRDTFGTHPLGTEGLSSARWVLVDLGDVVVHVFDGPMRGYYDLDGLWIDAPRLSLDSLGGVTDA